MNISKTSLYIIWTQLKQRCNNPKNKAYKYYGGRGISYSKKWEKFQGFYEDMGGTYKKGLTIERENNDGDYSKNNCKWKTQSIQNKNKSDTLIYKGKCLAYWCKKLNLNYNTINSRVYRGKTIKQALFA